MYKPKAIPAIRLPKQAELPTAEDVGRCMNSAQKTRGRTAELPWRSPMQNGEMTNIDCVLAAVWHKDDEEPIWSFFKGDGDPRQLRWRHQTRDLGLISVLCQRECLGADADLESKDRLSSGKKADADAETPAPATAPSVLPQPAAAPEAIGGLEPINGFDAPFQPVMPFAGIQPFNAVMPFQAQSPLQMPADTQSASMQQAESLPQQAFAQAAPVSPLTAINEQAAPAFNDQPSPAQLALAAAAATPVDNAVPVESNRMGFAEVESQPNRKATMAGDLVSMKVPNLLQSIVMGKMTGVLNVTHNETMIEVFIDEGNPVHASTPDCKGEAAIMELLTWEHGKFQFFSDERSNDRSVLKNLQTILMESAPLIDQFRFLNQSGISLNTYLMRKHPNISESEFEQRIARGAVTDLLKQKQFYQALDNQRNLFEVLRKMPLAKVDWVPCVYNLVVCDLVAVSNTTEQGSKALPLESTGVDRGLVQSGMKSLYNAETGLLTYPVVLHFLEQEFFRWEHSGAPFTLLVFDMCNRTPYGIEPLPPEALREAVKRIETVKRNVDCLAHFESNSFLLLMPFTRVQAATLVAKRLTEVLWDPTLGGALESSKLALAFGIAGVPEDCQDLGLLIAAAKQATTVSKQIATPVVAFQSGRRG